MQAASLKASEELLQQQQEELQQTNAELEEKAMLLEEQNMRIEIKNQEIEEARAALEEKAEQLALSSKYKSEFLANMSHELRTPLNSLLILARLFAENPEQNLTAKQLEFANTIYTAGSDLLDLINHILDLSKVEAGKMDVQVSDLSLADLRDQIDRGFRPVAEQKGLEFRVERPGRVARRTIATDEQRLQQILKNLLSNAFKFTHEGRSRCALRSPRRARASGTTRFARRRRSSPSPSRTPASAFADDKLKLIFEAFQQADGTTSRRYGGTGLGLSISREIARLLGGEIQVESALGKGSTFTLYLPVSHRPAAGRGERRPAHARAARSLRPGVDLESALAAAERRPRRPRRNRRGRPCRPDRRGRPRLRLDGARGGAGRGFKGIVALRGDVGLALAHEYRPDAVVLDMQLPGLDGWAVLDHLKRHPDTRHIPVHVITGGEQRAPPCAARRRGRVLEKPIEKEHLEETFAHMPSFIERGVRNLLVVDDDETQRRRSASCSATATTCV